MVSCAKRVALLPKLFYVSHGLAYAPVMNFLLAWLSHLGFTATVIGLLLSISPFVGSVFAPLLAAIADKTRRHRLVWTFSAAFSCVAITASLWLPSTVVTAAIVLFLFSAARSAASPLLDARVISEVGREYYGKQRLWLSISVGAFAFAAGATSDYLGIRSIFAYNIVGTALLIALIWCDVLIARIKRWRTKEKSSEASPPSEQQDDPAPVPQTRVAFLQAARLLLTRYEVVAALLRAFGTGLMQAQTSFLFLFLEKEFAVSKKLFGLYGLSIVCAVASEIPLFFFSKQVLAVLGDDLSILISQACFVVRVVSYTLIPRSIPWLVLPIELLHGPFFTLFWTASVATVSRCAPAGIEATAQGALSAVYTGLGYGTGSVVGGKVYSAAGPVLLFRGSAVVMAALMAYTIASSLVLRFVSKRKLAEKAGQVELKALTEDAAGDPDTKEPVTEDDGNAEKH
jgi:MFS family permease